MFIEIIKTVFQATIQFINGFLPPLMNFHNAINDSLIGKILTIFTLIGVISLVISRLIRLIKK